MSVNHCQNDPKEKLCFVLWEERIVRKLVNRDKGWWLWRIATKSLGRQASLPAVAAEVLLLVGSRTVKIPWKRLQYNLNSAHHRKKKGGECEILPILPAMSTETSPVKSCSMLWQQPYNRNICKSTFIEKPPCRREINKTTKNPQIYSSTINVFGKTWGMDTGESISCFPGLNFMARTV